MGGSTSRSQGTWLRRRAQHATLLLGFAGIYLDYDDERPDDPSLAFGALIPRYNPAVAAREPRRLGVEALYDYALRALARRPLTVGELTHRLRKRAASEADVQNIIERLRAVGYLDDTRLSESYAYFRRQYEGFGRKRVLMDLRKRGVAPEVAEEAVAESYHGVDDSEMIRQHLRRRLGGNMPDKPIDDRRKVLSLYRALVRAGFPSDKIVEALREIASDTDWLDALAEQHLESDEEVFD